ncbi:MAG: HEAT repeat domain-containing protein [Candidatus Kariarchaeaceae archaeon]
MNESNSWDEILESGSTPHKLAILHQIRNSPPPSESITKTIIGLIHEGAGLDIKVSAIHTLGHIKNKIAIPVLLDIVKKLDETVEVVVQAVESLVDMSAKEVEEIFYQYRYAEKVHPTIRSSCLWAYERLKNFPLPERKGDLSELK